MASVKGLKGGAVFGQFTLKYPLLAIAGIGIPMAMHLSALNLPFLSQSRLLIVTSIFDAIALGRLLYKKGLLQ